MTVQDLIDKLSKCDRIVAIRVHDPDAEKSQAREVQEHLFRLTSGDVVLHLKKK